MMDPIDIYYPIHIHLQQQDIHGGFFKIACKDHVGVQITARGRQPQKTKRMSFQSDSQFYPFNYSQPPIYVGILIFGHSIFQIL